MAAEPGRTCFQEWGRNVIVQHPAPRGNGGAVSLFRLWPFWVVLVLFEALLWLLLSLRFRQPCALVALAAGLTFGVAVQVAGGCRLRGGLWALGLMGLTAVLALYGQAAFHIARVLHLSPLRTLADTGSGFARLVLEGLLSSRDWWLVAAGLGLALLTGWGIPLPLRGRTGG